MIDLKKFICKEITSYYPHAGNTILYVLSEPQEFYQHFQKNNPKNNFITKEQDSKIDAAQFNSALRFACFAIDNTISLRPILCVFLLPYSVFNQMKNMSSDILGKWEIVKNSGSRDGRRIASYTIRDFEALNISTEQQLYIEYIKNNYSIEDILLGKKPVVLNNFVKEIENKEKINKFKFLDLL